MRVFRLYNLFGTINNSNKILICGLFRKQISYYLYLYEVFYTVNLTSLLTF